MFLPWRRPKNGGKSGPSPRPATPYRPRLEALEDRCLPASLTVLNTNDSGPGSLRQEIAAAASGDTIVFASGVSGTITLTTGEMNVTQSVTITGPGANVLTVSGNDASRVFQVAAGKTVTISGLTVAHGAPVADGGTDGGGILNDGALTLSNDVFTHNAATDGGAVANVALATLNVTGSTFVNNSAVSGGAVINDGMATFTNDTFFLNTATDSSGGALLADGGTTSLVNCTVDVNTAASTGGGAAITVGESQTTPTLQLLNTIIADNTANVSHPDVAGTVASQGHNLIGNGTGAAGFVGTDLVGTALAPIDPKLGALQDNGGPTPTQALQAGSPALDAAGPNGAPATDQRGVSRSGNPDIGAFQATIGVSISGPATFSPDNTYTLTLSVQDVETNDVTGWTVNWGDGTSTTVAGNPASVTHDYPLACADYTITATATTDDGAIAAAPLPVQARFTDPNAAFVLELYQAVLGHAPDRAGFRAWLNLLDSGAMTRAGVSTGVETSPERLEQVTGQFYFAFLGRSAEPGALVFWAGKMENGEGPAQVAIAILTSPEFLAAHPDPTSFAAALYLDVLGRPGSPAEVAALAQAVAAQGQQHVAAGVLSSAESFLDAIVQDYSGFLGRAARPDELQVWVVVLGSGGRTPTAFAVDFLASQEFFDRAQQLCLMA